MQEITITTPVEQHTYRVWVGGGLMARAGELLDADKYTKVFVVTDEHMEKLWLPQLLEGLPGDHQYLAVPPGEQAKRIDTVKQIWGALRRAGCDRHSLVVVLGGGVVGDMGAFAASTYERGLAFAHIPTTLLAQVDSSIGGKTGVDFDNIKNLVGTFAEPVAVISDTDALATLPQRELVAGFGEMIKHGLIRDREYFEALVAKPPAEYSVAELAGFIARSVKIKGGVVESDEKEANSRKLVNFGHTVGHAVEALSWETEHPLLHGEAVAIGMVAETDLSVRKGYMNPDEGKKVRAAISAMGLPVRIPHLQLKDIMEKMHADKKDIGGAIEFDLLRGIGRAFYDQTVEEDMVAAVLEHNMGPVHAR